MILFCMKKQEMEKAVLYFLLCKNVFSGPAFIKKREYFSFCGNKLCFVCLSKFVHFRFMYFEEFKFINDNY